METCCMGRLLHGRIGAAVAVAVAVSRCRSREPVVLLLDFGAARTSSKLLTCIMMAASTPNPTFAMATNHISSSPDTAFACLHLPLCLSGQRSVVLLLACLGKSWDFLAPMAATMVATCEAANRCRSESNASSIMSPFTFTFQASKPPSPLVTRHYCHPHECVTRLEDTRQPC